MSGRLNLCFFFKRPNLRLANFPGVRRLSLAGAQKCLEGKIFKELKLHRFEKFSSYKILPEYDDDTVEYVKTIADVTKWTFRNDFQEHFNGEYSRKYVIAYLNDNS